MGDTQTPRRESQPRDTYTLVEKIGQRRFVGFGPCGYSVESLIKQSGLLSQALVVE